MFPRTKILAAPLVGPPQNFYPRYAYAPTGGTDTPRQEDALKLHPAAWKSQRPATRGKRILHSLSNNLNVTSTGIYNVLVQVYYEHLSTNSVCISVVMCSCL